MQKKNVAKRVRNYEKFSVLFYVFCGIALLALILYVIAAISPGFANGYNRTVGAAVRAFLAYLTSFLPVSLAEMMLYAVPLLIVGIVIYAYRRRCETWRSTLVFIASVLAACSLLFSLFVFGFGTGYHTDPLEERLGLVTEEVSTDELRETAEYLAEKVNWAANGVSFGENGFSVMPYDLRELNDRLLQAYDPICDRYDFVQRLNSRIKPVQASRLMSYTHITGVYSYFTGEANLNVYFPDYTLPYTAAHELAHQRGIAREDEANFFEYVSSALYRADVEAYKTVIASLDKQVIGELRAYSAFFDEFRDSVAADVSNAVNDTYLKLNGNSDGTASYGLVVDLAVAYHKADLL